METVNWKVDGMTCSNCALTIQQYLKKEGLKDVKVDLMGGDVSFGLDTEKNKQQIKKGIESLGYSVQAGEGAAKETKKRFFSSHRNRFLVCLLFTAPLLLHMFDKWMSLHWLMDPWVQLGLCAPVYLIGMDFFGRSAWQSIRNGM